MAATPAFQESFNLPLWSTIVVKFQWYDLPRLTIRELGFNQRNMENGVHTHQRGQLELDGSNPILVYQPFSSTGPNQGLNPDRANPLGQRFGGTLTLELNIPSAEQDLLTQDIFYIPPGSISEFFLTLLRG